MSSRDRHALKVCATCKMIVTEAGPDTWVHVYEPRPHEVVPEDYGGIPYNVECDFCSSRILRGELAVVPLEPFQLPPDGTRQSSDGDWTACRLCGSLIEGDHWDILVRRSILRYEEESRLLGEPPMDRAELADWLTKAYALVRDHMTGPIRPWRAGDEQELL